MKCGDTARVVVRLIGAVVYLLVGTIIAIKGVLPYRSSQPRHEDVETRLLESRETSRMDTRTSQQMEEENRKDNRSQEQQMDEEDSNPSNPSTQQTDEIEVTKIKLVTSLKVTHKASFSPLFYYI